MFDNICLSVTDLVVDELEPDCCLLLGVLPAAAHGLGRGAVLAVPCGADGPGSGVP